MCHLAMAAIAASLEMSCVTAAFLLLGSRLQAKVCKQPLDLPVVQPQGFGKAMENPTWCSQKSSGETLGVCMWSISNTFGCFWQWAGCRQVPWAQVGF